MAKLIIDVREPNEYAAGHVEGSINIPPAEILAGAEKLKNVPKQTELILYCNTGSRSNVCKHILETMGYSNVINAINKDHVKSRYLEGA